MVQEAIDRINKLTADTQPLWGKMNVAQMLAHLKSQRTSYNRFDLWLPGGGNRKSFDSESKVS